MKNKMEYDLTLKAMGRAKNILLNKLDKKKELIQQFKFEKDLYRKERHQAKARRGWLNRTLAELRNISK